MEEVWIINKDVENIDDVETYFFFLKHVNPLLLVYVQTAEHWSKQEISKKHIVNK